MHAAGASCRRHKVIIQAINNHMLALIRQQTCPGRVHLPAWGFRISVSICQSADWRTDHHGHLARNLHVRHPLASTFLRKYHG